MDKVYLNLRLPCAQRFAADLMDRVEQNAVAPAAVDGARPELAVPGEQSPLDYFGGMIDRCYDYAEDARANCRPIVGIMCEFTPRELLLAVNAVPVCLCGGSAGTIGPAERFLPSNLCPLIKSTFGYQVQGTNPFLNWAELVVAETTCDGKKKMFELLGKTKELYVLELPQKSDEPDAFEHWVFELRKFVSYLEKRFRVGVTGAALRSAIDLMNRERGLRRALADLMMLDPPPLSGRELLELKSIISGIESDLCQYGTAVEWFKNRSPRYRLGLRPPVRVLLTGVPLVHGAERVMDLIEKCGAVVVCQENCTGLKPIIEDVETAEEPDLLRALARKYYHLPCSVMTPNTRRLENLRQLNRQFRPDCVIELVWQACLTYDVESYQVRKLVEGELGLPYLKITTDYSPSDSARITSRVEALCETVNGKRANL